MQGISRVLGLEIKIPKTLFILKYRDDPLLRQAKEKQLNKVEGSNKFSKAVSFGHRHEFIQVKRKTKRLLRAAGA